MSLVLPLLFLVLFFSIVLIMDPVFEVVGETTDDCTAPLCLPVFFEIEFELSYGEIPVFWRKELGFTYDRASYLLIWEICCCKDWLLDVFIRFRC